MTEVTADEMREPGRIAAWVNALQRVGLRQAATAAELAARVLELESRCMRCGFKHLECVCVAQLSNVVATVNDLALRMRSIKDIEDEQSALHRRVDDTNAWLGQHKARLDKLEAAQLAQLQTQEANVRHYTSARGESSTWVKLDDVQTLVRVVKAWCDDWAAANGVYEAGTYHSLRDPKDAHPDSFHYQWVREALKPFVEGL